MLVYRVDKSFAHGFVGEPGKKRHPAVEVGAHVFSSHTLVIVLYNLDEGTNNLGKEGDAN